MRVHRLLTSLVVIALLGVSACGDDDTSDDGATTTTEAPADEADTSGDEGAAGEDDGEDPAGEDVAGEDADDRLVILVTNDDGIGAPGIDAMVTALETLDAELIVVAPVDNQSGSSDNTTEGAVDWDDAETASGFEAIAVQGTPADSVNVALDELGIEPDLVVSGINDVHNIGPLVPISGTVGAARTALRRGIPAVAVSTGMEEGADFESAARVALDWLEENLDELQTDFVANINTPNCVAGEMKDELVEVPVAEALVPGENDDPFASDCTQELEDPPDDTTALDAGYPSLSMVPADL
jgi:5'-nucleotidase